jgi:tetratricopeptide (TPR) repeat protein
MNCLSSQELSRAISDGVEPAHLAGCASCTRELMATREMIELARDAAPALPPQARREEVRTMLLAAGRSADVLAPHPRSRARYAVAGALALAAAAIAIVVVREPATPAGHFHATVRPLAGADYTATQRAPDEIVYLRDGAIDVEVAPLHAGERFRIVLEDAEVEVHGTRFVATAAAGKLVAVDVAHGIVEVRARGAGSVLLRVGESWRPPVVTPVITALPASRPAPPEPPPPVRTKRVVKAAPPTVPPAPAEVTPPAVVPPTPKIERLPQERAYDEGWAAMRAGTFAEAAKDFARVQLLDPGGALAEDATYWYAVALARANDSAQAITAFGDFLDHYPKSRRAGEASAMLGWLLVGAQQPAEAERRFRAAVNDPAPAVRDSARAGLDAVRERR